jgi:phenylacetate-coenzyme A ligase PaaK-like adenylate-forming protein
MTELIAESLKSKIFKITSQNEFNDLALEIFRNQAVFNKIYKEYLRIIGINAPAVRKPEDIPFLPIELFKYHKILTGGTRHEIKFESSGTTGTLKSKHFIIDPELYTDSFSRCFKLFYGSPEKYCILALLPSYLERKNSSLVYMVNQLIQTSHHESSGFYLNDLSALHETLTKLENKKQPAILLGVSFALIRMAEKFPMPLEHTIIMETGGMKGKQEEMTREELHGLLKNAFHVKEIHSEYGMTELLSQAYSKGNGLFHSPPWMRILIRDLYDPCAYISTGKSGGINIIDLANIHSCSFIATQDIGKLHSNGGFEVLGRFDSSDTRGCNLITD